MATTDSATSAIQDPPPDVLGALVHITHRAAKVGIYFQRKLDGSLVLKGPTRTYPDLVKGLRRHKAHIAQLIDESLAAQVLGADEVAPGFDSVTCPVCQQACYVLEADEKAPRRVCSHRSDAAGKEVCPGSRQAL